MLACFEHCEADGINVRKPKQPARRNSMDALHLPRQSQLAAEGADAYINSELIGPGIDELNNATIGLGRRLQPRPDWEELGWNPDQYTDFTSTNRRLFHRHMSSKRRWIDQEGECTLAAMQRMVLATTLTQGEMYTLAYQFDTPARPFRTALGLIDRDRVRTPRDLSDRDKEQVTCGHRKSDAGFTRSYFVHAYHRNDPRNRRKVEEDYTEVRRYNEFGREQVIHTYLKKAPGLTRGLSQLTSAFHKIKCFEQYEQIRIEASILQTAMAFIIKSNDKNVLSQTIGQTPLVDQPEDYEAKLKQNVLKATKSQQYHNKSGISLDGAKAIRLLEGEDAEILTGSASAVNDQQFVDECMTSIARAMGMTKSTLTQRFEASYSAARAELISFYRQCEMYGEFIVNDWLRSVYAIWLEDVIQLGLLKIPNYPDPNLAWLHFIENRELYCDADFMGPGRDEIDQAKSMAYWKARLETGNFNFRDFYNSKGKDWQDEVIQQAEELKFIDKIFSGCDFKIIKDPMKYILPSLDKGPATATTIGNIEDETTSSG